MSDMRKFILREKNYDSCNWLISYRANLTEFEYWKELEMGKSWHFYVGEGNDIFASIYILSFLCAFSLDYFPQCCKLNILYFLIKTQHTMII